MDPAAPASIDTSHFHEWTPYRRLMRTFDDTESLAPSTKERLRPRVWACLNDVSELEFKEASLPEEYIIPAGILAAFSVAPILAFIWSGGESALPFGAIGIALLINFVALFATTTVPSHFTSGYQKAFFPSIAALAILLLGSLPLVAPHTAPWLSVGMRSGLIGAIVIALTSGLFLATNLFEGFSRWQDERRSFRKPEAYTVVRLLEVIDALEQLDLLEKHRDQNISQTMAIISRRNEQHESLKTANVSAFDIANTTRKPDGTEHRTYELTAYRKDTGKWETVFSEGQTVVPIEPKLQEIRQGAMRSIEGARRVLEHGLFERLRVGSAQIDEWMRSELGGRAQTVKGWGRQIALSPRSDRSQLLAQVAAIVEFAADQDWASIPKTETSQFTGIWLRLLKFGRRAIVGILPLGFVLAAPPLGLAIPLPIRDSLLTFALPWLLLQLIELVSPDAGDYLERSKGIRDMLPKSLTSGAEGRR